MPHHSQKPARTARDERRSAILEIANAAFLAEGYAATSMSTIAAKVGGSKATLYNYFQSKEELFAAVIECKCEQIHAMFSEMDFVGENFAASLRQGGRGLVHSLMAEDRIAMFRVVAAEVPRFPELGRAIFEAGFERGRARMAEAFARAIASGNLKAVDPDLLAERFFDLCASDLIYRRLCNVSQGTTAEEVERKVDCGVALFLQLFDTRSSPAAGLQ